MIIRKNTSGGFLLQLHTEPQNHRRKLNEGHPKGTQPTALILKIMKLKTGKDMPLITQLLGD